MKFLNKIDSAEQLIQDENNRLVTDVEKTKWDTVIDKETPAGAQTKATKALTDSKAYVDGKVKTDVPVGAKFTDTIIDISGKQDVLAYTPLNKAGDKMTGSLEVKSASFPVVDIIRNTGGSGSGLYGGAKLVRETSSPKDGVGIGFYFGAPNSVGAVKHAGMLGGALGSIIPGAEKGEIVLAPSYAGQDPYTRRDLVVRAISATRSEAELNGKLITDQTALSDSDKTVTTKGYVDSNVVAHKTDAAPHQYGGKFEWKYNAATNSLDLVVL